MTPTHQHLLTQLRELHKQIGEVLQQLEQAEQTPDRPDLKPGDKAPAIEWLKLMDEPERSEALKWAKDDSTKRRPEQIVQFIHEAIASAFDWAISGELEFWIDIYDKYYSSNR